MRTYKILVIEIHYPEFVAANEIKDYARDALEHYCHGVPGPVRASNFKIKAPKSRMTFNGVVRGDKLTGR